MISKYFFKIFLCSTLIICLLILFPVDLNTLFSNNIYEKLFECLMPKISNLCVEFIIFLALLACNFNTKLQNICLKIRQEKILFITKSLVKISAVFASFSMFCIFYQRLDLLYLYTMCSVMSLIYAKAIHFLSKKMRLINYLSVKEKLNLQKYIA